MKIWSFLVTWSLCTSVSQAQPFDTLLSQFNYITELYPLADSTYILIGVKDNYRVERIDRMANVLWSVDLPSWKEYSMADFKINTSPNDTSIQLLFTDDGCNVEEVESYGCYTLNAQGILTDQLSWPAEWGFPFLLSGQPGRPRIGIASDTFCILIDALGDTMQILLTWPDGDTSNWDLIGPPRRMAMSPNGDLLVGGTLYVFMLHLQSGIFKVYDTSITFYQHLICFPLRIAVLLKCENIH